jgi:S-adenosylmethionine:diacylglycerol 3-amino-3-carboxypropyl transferase
MLPIPEPAGTPWLQGAFRARPHGLVFGQSYEDPEIELRAVPPGGAVFCIAGAGYTAQAMAAAGHRVTAVDVNSVQLDYSQARIARGLAREGIAERLLGLGRRLNALCGWSSKKIDAFLSISRCSEQVEYWDRELDTPLWRTVFDTLLAPRLLHLFYRSPFLAALPSDFGPRLRQRLRRGWAHHANPSNPFAALLLSGKPMICQQQPALPIRWVCADAAEFLEQSAPGSFDLFALSNIGDGVGAHYRHRLLAAVEHAAAPQAIVVSRSFAAPPSSGAANHAAADRSLLWGTVGVCPLSAIGQGGASCCIC